MMQLLRIWQQLWGPDMCRSLAAVAGNTRRVGAQLASEAEIRLEVLGKLGHTSSLPR